MWDEVYRSTDYVYGVEPNDFLRKHANHLPKGKILSLAEGEGRNAVYLAKLGYEVTAVDCSMVGLEKARLLAKHNGVDINFIHSDLVDFDIGWNQWDGIVSIFCPLSSEQRASVLRRVELGLKVGGVFLTESYTPEQIKYGTGGGNNPDTMQTRETLTEELKMLSFILLTECEREVIEGTYHTGLASVVQGIGRKQFCPL
ncbi:class I SAM-dependent methyltransferase [Vibrio sonorensis]|uniref:class I SAM-dependent methyltransferase n=1 Tax=Vibrio sonorensis TaxID=1004316 RepID=UPI0008DAE944|nr:class I SAM-dependent methyltransferase [Vibrio sonorensis]